MKLRKTNNSKAKETPLNSGEPKYSDLRQIMDRNRVFNIIYSGVEQESYFNILYSMGIRNFLMSFHYVQNRHLSMSQMYAGKGVKFFIDSGAHTYQNDPKYAEYDLDYWEEHLKKYLRWAEKNREYIFAIASFDFENLVGAEVVKKWNEQYLEPFMLRTGIPVCFVWHQNSHQSWEYYCKRYPYVGFSSVNTEGVAIDLREYQDKLRVAEKHKSLVHGFGMTRTSMLTQLPFYTADSTTWLVGLQYGEINFWNGKKMSRLKKDLWKGTMLPQIVQKGFSEQKLLEEDVEELVKVNVYAFIEAEKYIHDRLKSRMYWLRPEENKRSEESLADLDYPSVEWLRLPHGQRPDVEEYAQRFNVSTVIMDEAESLVADITCFMNWDNPEYTEYISEVYTPELISEIHNLYINRIVQSDEERISDLMDFYKRNLMGEDTTLLYLGTNFDRIVKEREDKDYITDDVEYEYYDLSPVEVGNRIGNLLPPSSEGAPEIDELDDEIFKEAGIVPVRDANGRFLKGQQAVLKPKNLYSSKYPKLACDTCFNAQRCPQYKAGYVCAYNKMFKRFDTRNQGDVVRAMQSIVDFSLSRLQLGMLTETLNGGIPDPNVTNMMNQSMGYLSQLQRMQMAMNQEVVRQTRIMRADGSQETTTQVSNPQGGILAKIFGGMNEEPKPETKDSDYVEAEE